MNPARDAGPKLFAYFAGWGKIALTGGRDIPYMLIPIFGPIVGACLGALSYRTLIGRNLPCDVCATDDDTAASAQTRKV
ncbi:Glycerol uptake facilitator protein [Dickeya solani]|nr:Glycerol uptake facilitator protein [Dickeya solani]